MTLEVGFVLVAAFGAGFVDAMAGGGGLIQLPALFAAFPQAPHTTLLGTGKLAGLAGTTSSIFRFLRHVRLDWRLVLWASAGAFVAALVGAWVATVLPPARFRALVPVLLTVVLLYTLLHRDLGHVHRPRYNGRHGHMLAAGTAGLIGLYDGFFGPGNWQLPRIPVRPRVRARFFARLGICEGGQCGRERRSHHPVRRDGRTVLVAGSGDGGLQRHRRPDR